MVVCMDVMKDKLWCKEEQEDRHVLEQLCDPRMDAMVEWLTAYVALDRCSSLGIVGLSFLLPVLIDLILFPIKVAILVARTIVAWRFHPFLKRCMLQGRPDW